MTDDADDMPHNIRAEQALLGILLYDNFAIESLPPNFRAAHMYDPVHAELMDVVLETIQRGGSADLIVLQERFSQSKALEQMGGFNYLADLVDHAPSTTQTGDLGLLITDLALRRELIKRGRELIDAAMNKREMPALEIIDDLQRRLYEMETFQEEGGLAALDNVFGEALDMAAAAYLRDGELRGLPTGLADLDKKMGGCAPTDLIILAARPSMGKSSLALNVAESTVKAYKRETVEGEDKVTKGGVVAFFSLEMSKGQLGMRLLSSATDVSSERIAKGQIDATEFGRLRDAAVELRDAPLYIDDTGGISVEKIATRCRRLKRTVGLHMIVVDYLQLVTCAGADKMSVAERVSFVSGALKALAKELNVPVIALAQLSRRIDERSDKRPLLSDLKDSGAIEQDADIVLFVYRESYYLERSIPKEGSAEHMKWEEELDRCMNEAEIIVGKNRHGSAGVVKTLFKRETTKFADTVKEEYQQAA